HINRSAFEFRKSGSGLKRMRRGLCPAKLKIGKPDRNFALSAQKIQNSLQHFLFPRGKCRIPVQHFAFPRGKCQISRSISLFLRSISEFPCGKYEMPGRDRIRTICRSRRDDNCEDMDEVYEQPEKFVTLGSHSSESSLRLKHERSPRVQFT